MNFTIYLIGEKINKSYHEAMKEYMKRLSRYCKAQLIHIKKEEQLLKKLPNRAYRMMISTTGQGISSEELATRINDLAVSGNSDIALLIGAENVDHHELLSISPMKMDPGLKAVILLEQIYRAYRILNNQPYHK